MFDRWENLRIFFKKYHNIKKKTYYFDCGDDIFYNSNTEDFHNKTKGDDFWNHKNYIRIIKFKYLDKITLKEQKYTKYSNIQKSKKSYKLRNILSIRNVLKQLFNGLDFAFSYFAIRINKIILDTFYFSKLNQLKIFFRLRLIPSFYHYTFKDVSFGLKKN